MRIWLNRIVTTLPDPLPTDLAAAHAMILAQREMLAEARSEAKVWALEIERLKLMLARARRETFGQSSERGKQLIEQLELAIAARRLRPRKRPRPRSPLLRSKKRSANGQGSSRRAGRCRTIFRASASSIRRLVPVANTAVRTCANSARL